MNKNRGKQSNPPSWFRPVRIMMLFLVLMIATLLWTYPGSQGEGSSTKTENSIKVDSSRTPQLRTSPALTTVIQPPTKAVSPPRVGSDMGVVPAGAPRKRIAYAITVTKDGPFVDGALVLGYAARKYHDAQKGFPSQYDVDLVAFVVPTVTSTREILTKFGWRIIEREIPVALDEIENQKYADAMRNSGCCGADEFLKLWAYTLTEYHRVIHLDMDSILFKNMDELYEMDYELLFTGDYNMKAGSPVAPAQGGFLVVRPSMEAFNEYKAIIKKGDHGPGGWGGSHIGNFWGGQTIQGIVPYFYHVHHPGKAKELNRCEYNCMVDNPRRKDSKGNDGKCLDGKETCQDCRAQDGELVSSAHFTICQKPWTCTQHLNPKNARLCTIFHDKWFALRNEFETDLGIDTSYRATETRYKNSLGMCSGYGDKKYNPIPIDRVTKAWGK